MKTSTVRFGYVMAVLLVACCTGALAGPYGIVVPPGVKPTRITATGEIDHGSKGHRYRYTLSFWNVGAMLDEKHAVVDVLIQHKGSQWPPDWSGKTTCLFSGGPRGVFSGGRQEMSKKYPPKSEWTAAQRRTAASSGALDATPLRASGFLGGLDGLSLGLFCINVWEKGEGFSWDYAPVRVSPANAWAGFDQPAQEPTKPPTDDKPKVDVAIDPEEWSFCADAFGQKIPVEKAADQQGVMAYVRNRSANVTAEKIEVQLWLGPPGLKGSRKVGDPVIVRDLRPRRVEAASLIWPLTGNVEKAPLHVQALPTTQVDEDLTNNTRNAEVSIYYAHNGSRAYSFPTDGYSFANYSMKPDEAEDIVEAWLTGILGQSGSDPQLQEVMVRLVYPWTYTRFMNYVTESAELGVGGHCYGMSATSAEYFQGDLSRPAGVAATAALKQEQASFNIALYHRAQMRSAMGGALTGDNAPWATDGVQKTVDTLRASLRDQRRPLIISFGGKKAVPDKPGEFTSWGHAVLGYKMVDWGNNKYCVYLYDSNFKPSSIIDKPMPFFTFNTVSGQWGFPLYMPYPGIITGWTYAAPPHRTIPPTVMSALVPQIKLALAETAKLLAAGNKLLAVLRCPADALITDGQGGAIGIQAGKGVNTIPGAEVLSDQGAKIYLLPGGRTYSVALSRTGAGDIGFDVLRAEPGNKIGVVSYGKLPIAAGGKAQVSLAADGKTTSAQVGGKTIAPSLTGLSDEIKAPPPSPQPPSTLPPTAPVATPPAAPVRTPPTAAAAPAKRFVLTSSSHGIVFTDDYPREDFDVQLEVTCTQPGTIFDTMGLNIAPTGSWSVAVTADNHLAFNLWDGRQWSTLNSQATISRGQATKVRLWRQGPAVRFSIGGKPEASASLPTPLSGKPIYVGDFKGDEQWGAAYRIHQGLVGTVRVLYLGSLRP